VAIKVLHPELARDATFRQRFDGEVAAARAVSGMYTAPVVAAGLDDDPPWLATAFVPGPSLAEVVAKHGPLPEPAVWRLAAGLAEALCAVHACGLVHRDLKPANVLLAADGPRVVDFGISRALEGTSVTTAGMLFGTPSYMSPEQAEGTVAGPASDVFSLGCLLSYAATGNAPFGGGSAASVLYRVVHSPADLGEIPGKLRDVILACLEKTPSERPRLTALSTMVSHSGPALTATATSFWPEPVAGYIRAGQEGDLTQESPDSDSVTDGYSTCLMPVEGPAVADSAVARLMYGGVAATVVNVIAGGMAIARWDVTADKHPHLRLGKEAHAMGVTVAGVTVLGGIIGVCCWLWLAWACRRGRAWTPIAGTALLGLDTVGTLIVMLTTHGDHKVQVSAAAVWAIGLITVVLLWGRKRGAHGSH